MSLDIRYSARNQMRLAQPGSLDERKVSTAKAASMTIVTPAISGARIRITHSVPHEDAAIWFPRGFSPPEFERCSDHQTRDNSGGMKPLLLAVELWLAAGVVSPAADLQDAPRDPDRLYADRERLDSAFDAASIWDARLKKDPKDFEAAWKLARACYWLGGHAAPDARRAQYERGIEAARQ